MTEKTVYAKASEPILFKPVSQEERSQLEGVLARNYPQLGMPQAIELCAEKTVASKVYSVSADRERYVLRHLLWRPFATEEERTFAQKANEFVFHVSELLRNEGLPIPQTISTKDGKFVAHDGGNFYVVQEFAEGRHMVRTKQELYAAGEVLAKLHVAGLRLLDRQPGLKEEILKYLVIEKPYEESVAVWESSLKEDVQNNVFHDETHDPHCNKPKVCGYVRGHVADISRMIGVVQRNLSGVHLPLGITHNDLSPNNILCTDDGKVSAVIDLDNIYITPIAEDIANSLIQFTTNAVKNGVFSDVTSASKKFVDGYNSVRQISEEEKKSLVPFMVRWGLFRTLRILRRHHYEGTRLEDFMDKLPVTTLPRVFTLEENFSFLTGERT